MPSPATTTSMLTSYARRSPVAGASTPSISPVRSKWTCSSCAGLASRHLPPPGLRRAEHRVNDRHIANRVLQCHRHASLSAHRLGKSLGLEEKLIRGGHLDGLGSPAGQVAAVAHPAEARAALG